MRAVDGGGPSAGNTDLRLAWLGCWRCGRANRGHGVGLLLLVVVLLLRVRLPDMLLRPPHVAASASRPNKLHPSRCLLRPRLPCLCCLRPPSHVCPNCHWPAIQDLPPPAWVPKTNYLNQVPRLPNRDASSPEYQESEIAKKSLFWSARKYHCFWLQSYRIQSPRRKRSNCMLSDMMARCFCR